MLTAADDEAVVLRLELTPGRRIIREHSRDEVLVTFEAIGVHAFVRDQSLGTCKVVKRATNNYTVVADLSAVSAAQKRVVVKLGAVTMYSGSTSADTVVPSVLDHMPSRPDERARVRLVL